MIGKLIVHGRIAQPRSHGFRAALDEFEVGPIGTTIPLHRRLMDYPPFMNADFIHYVERWLEEPAANA